MANMDSEKPVEQKYEAVYDHLRVVDQTLSDIAEDIKADIAEEINEANIDVSYDIYSGEIEAQLPLNTVTSRLNRRLDPPFFVKEEEGKIVVLHIREEFDHLDIEDGDIVGDRERIKTLKSIISHIEEGHEDGAPEGRVVEFAVYLGLEKNRAQHEINKLKQKGEVYEPKQEHIRTT